MKRHWNVLAAATAAVVVLVPAALANTPNGVGLFKDHESHCVGASLPGGEYDGRLTMSGGNSFWIPALGVHLVVQSGTIAYDEGANLPPIEFQIGNKTGQQGDMVTCTGHFAATDKSPGYTVTSHDVIVP